MNCCRLFFSIISSIIFCSVLQAQKRISVQEYIDTYKEIAIREMERTGIPASITLAQGIHESGSGNSSLAKEAKNHFGIKCASDWKGKEYYKWDDEAQESCFRVYEDAEKSYLDHSAILTKRKRYAFLFDYDKTDYKRWARGLKKAGYATDPKYPVKLINTIERHQLDQYDLAMSAIVMNPDANNNYQNIINEEPDIFVTPEEMTRKFRKKPRSFLFPKYKAGMNLQNGASYVIAKKGETALEIASRFDIPYRKFLRFNDLVDGDQLMDYQYCYIQPKKSKYKGKENTFKVEKDITMYEIAQYLGIKLGQLRQLNLLEEGQEPRNGSIIMLKAKANTAPPIRLKSGDDELPIDHSDDIDEPAPHFPDDKEKDPVIVPVPDLEVDVPAYRDSIYSDSINTANNKDERYLGIDPIPADFDIKKDSFEWERPVFPNPEPTVEIEEEPRPRIAPFDPFSNQPTEKEKEKIIVPEYKIHVVRPQETLYSISVQYKVNWQSIKSINGLKSNTISVNQKLKIPTQ